MDSGNSGSMQSSSGGDEEYDSRAESISALLSNTAASQLHHHHIGSSMAAAAANPHQSNHNQTTTTTTMFDPLSHLFDPGLSSSSSSRHQIPLSNPNSLLNLDMSWSKNLRSDPNSIDLSGGGLVQPDAHNPPFFSGGGSSSFPAVQISPENAGREQNSSSGMGVVGRNPKKRSRASRRAPTTVLTTDTSNFRAMVQEFTGIPAPPFSSSSSPFPRTRLDLFGSCPSLKSPSSPSHHPPPPPPYLLRPFAQKPPPFLHSSSSSSSSSSSMVLDGLVSNSTPPTTSASLPINFQHLSSSSSSSSLSSSLSDHQLGLLKQHQQLHNNNTSVTTTNNNSNNIVNIGGSAGGGIQNPLVNFQSFLQQTHKYPSLSSSSSAGVDEFGLSHGNVSFHNILSSSNPNNGALSRPDTHSPTTTMMMTTNWVAIGGGVGSSTTNNNTSSGVDDQSLLLSSLNGSYRHNHNHNSNNNSNQEQLTNGKLSFSTAAASSASDFHGGDKPTQPARTEGMVESWICSSD